MMGQVDRGTRSCPNPSLRPCDPRRSGRRSSPRHHLPQLKSLILFRLPRVNPRFSLCLLARAPGSPPYRRRHPPPHARQQMRDPYLPLTAPAGVLPIRLRLPNSLGPFRTLRPTPSSEPFRSSKVRPHTSSVGNHTRSGRLPRRRPNRPRSRSSRRVGPIDHSALRDHRCPATSRGSVRFRLRSTRPQRISFTISRVR